jgi:membrane protease subunit (stomatin/prohibitin family)
MGLRDFIKKQFIDVIHWTETGEGVLAYRYPMQDMEIQYGAQLTVRESQMALFVNEGKAADAFGPGLYTLETRTLPILTNLQNWDKAFQSPFKSDLYFFSTRIQTNQKWGTPNPITIRDKDFGMVRLRGFGLYSYHIANPLVFHQKVSGTRDLYTVAELDGHLRNTIVGRVSDAFAQSQIPFLDMAANLVELSQTLGQQLAPTFADFGLTLDSFVVENLSLPEELQKRLDERIGMNMVGNLRDYTQFQIAQSMPIAAANEGGGGAGLGAGMGAGMAMGKAMADALNPNAPGGASSAPNAAAGGGAPSPAGSSAPSAAGATKFCTSCGKSIARNAKFCSECGGAQ